MNLSQARLKQIIKESMHDLNWDDYFSAHRESGGEARVDDIMEKLRAGKSLSPDEADFILMKLEGVDELAGLKGSEEFKKRDRRGF